MHPSLCQRAHAALIFGVCPWCQKRIANGHPVQEYDELKKRILSKLHDKFDRRRAREYTELLRDELRKAVERLCILKAVALSRMELEGLVEEILAEFLGQP